MPLNPMAETDAKGLVIAYCPFPECDGDMDELGHCRHFIGTSSDGKTFDRCLPLIRKYRDGTEYDTGFKTTSPGKATPNRLNASELIPEGCEKVNPQLKQVVNGVESLYFKWHDWRIYQRDANYVPSVPHPMPGDPPVAPVLPPVDISAQLELERAKQRTLELELQLRKKEKRTSKGRHKRMAKPQPEPIGVD